jgi:opacity protein-like surface antigen
MMVLPMPLAAQSRPAPAWAYTVEAHGGVGNGRLYLGDSLWGSGPDWSVGAGVRPFSGWSDRLGFDVLWVRLKDSGSSGSQVSHRLSASLVAANVVYHFRGRTRIQPYLFGGLGHLNADYTYRCVDCVFDPDPVTGMPVSRGVEDWRDKGSKTGFTYGGGVKVAVQRQLSIRPQLLLADTTPGSGYNWTWVQAEIGLGVHF